MLKIFIIFFLINFISFSVSILRCNIKNTVDEPLITLEKEIEGTLCDPTLEGTCIDNDKYFCKLNTSNSLYSCFYKHYKLAGESCNNHFDCLHQQCENGVCFQPTYPQCYSSLFCKSNEVCKHLSYGKMCVPYDPNSCDYFVDCKPSHTCLNNTCVPKFSQKVNSSCSRDTDCDLSDSLYCEDFKCKKFIPTLNRDCRVFPCLNSRETCVCDQNEETGICTPSFNFNQECKDAEEQLDQCLEKFNCVHTTRTTRCYLLFCEKFVTKRDFACIV
ncbi:hypothetical protein DLAC_06195 [Tieghemostelium lacteum]|uniref:Uncharacterized protein n=1 Tax=Tieghemostelium lacteum TaxID=361077 RepID=A0A151ZHX2_TIELA|nr:hypothetical protein DLAC_06195 [Tieghemostelium lacteum]|eukprot:KYQ93499.1 hypothetical protein DLAC_06195 [Tieghemostelium lacteum]